MNDDDSRRKLMELYCAGMMRSIKQGLPAQMGVLFVLFDYGEGGDLAYTSTGKREDCVRLLRELISRLEGN